MKRKIVTMMILLTMCVGLVACGNKAAITEDSGTTAVQEEAASEEGTEADTSEAASEGEATYVEATKDDFEFSELDDGTLMIKKYVGEAPYIIIPEDISGKKITIVDGLFGDTLKGVVLPDSVKTIVDRAFNNSENLEEVKLGNSVETIEGYAFINCYKLKSINLPDSITSIGECALNGNALEEISIPAGVTELPDGVFCNGCWKELTIPGTVKVVGEEAFAGNDELTKVTVEDGVEEIKHAAFRHCDKIEELHIPASVTAFEDGKIVDSTDILTIYAPAGSAAEAYANENDINFVAE